MNFIPIYREDANTVFWYADPKDAVDANHAVAIWQENLHRKYMPGRWVIGVIPEGVMKRLHAEGQKVDAWGRAETFSQKKWQEWLQNTIFCHPEFVVANPDEPLLRGRLTVKSQGPRREPDHAPFWWEMKQPSPDDAMAVTRALCGDSKRS